MVVQGVTMAAQDTTMPGKSALNLSQNARSRVDRFLDHLASYSAASTRSGSPTSGRPP
jgi:hypothetical protein